MLRHKPTGLNCACAANANKLRLKANKLNPVSGSCASLGGAISLGLATLGGIPVSTTHTITGAIVGVGAAQDVKAVRWGITMNLIVAWILTIPASGLIAALCWKLGLFFL